MMKVHSKFCYFEYLKICKRIKTLLVNIGLFMKYISIEN